MRAPWIAILAFAVLSGCSTTMRISRSELQTDMAKRFPIKADKHVVVLTASDPQIEFPGTTDVVGVRLRVDAVSASGNSQLTGTTRVEGRVEYIEAERSLYLRDPKVTELVLAPAEGDGSLAHASNALSGKLVERAARSAIEALLRTHPIYRLDATRSEQEAKAIRHLRSVHVEGQDLVLEVGL